MWTLATPARQTVPIDYDSTMYNHNTLPRNFHPVAWSSTENSPESVLTTDTSPQRSPRTNFLNGPQLLPKIRYQDQTVEPTASAGPVAHSRAASLGVPHIHTTFPAASSFYRRPTGSPDDFETYESPHSAVSMPASVFSNNLSASSTMTAMSTPISVQLAPIQTHSSTTQVPAPPRFSPTPSPLHQISQSPGPEYAQHVRSSSRQSSVSHIRHLTAEIAPQHRPRAASQSSAIDEATLLKHGYPTQYRKIPQYMTASSQAPAVRPLPMQTIASQPAESLNYMYHNETSQAAPLVVAEHPLSASVKTTTLLNYLTGPCVRPTLIARSISDAQRHWDYGWWDVRNLRNWSSFSMESLMQVPGFDQLLDIPLAEELLPHPQPVTAQPDTEYSLRDIHKDYFATRVNAALEIAQGQHHLLLRAVNSKTIHHYPKPDFIATYENDYLRTLRQEERGRLVGIVKAYEEWNTGMRTESAGSQVKYLKGLAQLHRVMREHGCRYGFIVSEIELLCVRAGAEDGEYNASRMSAHSMSAMNSALDQGPKPIFGMLETAKPISLSTSTAGTSTSTNTADNGIAIASRAAQLTPALALWYLHMLAKEEPLLGHPSWKMDVGGPAALTRANCRPRDDWMPKVVASETRSAKRLRGWVYPSDPLHRRETPNSRRRRA